jgi:hypothetical protein
MLDIRNSLPFSGIERNLSIFYLAKDDIKRRRLIYFRRNEQPSVSLALPPVG